jgi:hypothetical protein
LGHQDQPEADARDRERERDRIDPARSRIADLSQFLERLTVPTRIWRAARRSANVVVHREGAAENDGRDRNSKERPHRDDLLTSDAGDASSVCPGPFRNLKSVASTEYPWHLFSFAASAAGVPRPERTIFPTPTENGHHVKEGAPIEFIIAASSILAIVAWWRLRVALDSRIVGEKH